MGRKLAKRFIICFGLCSLTSLAAYFYQGGTFRIELFQIMILGAFLALNLCYLSLLIEKTDSTVAIVAFIALLVASSLFLYLDRALDIRLHFVLILVALIVINMTATFILRKSSPP
jgi:hypothetical protein